jgi:hypothetical protein
MSDWPTLDTMAAYIKQQAPVYGIDPNVALSVAQSEGLNQKAVKDNFVVPDAGSVSIGPYQLYMGGGMGNDFQNKFGAAPSADNWKQQIDFSLNQAAYGGTGWAKWFGAKRVGISQFQGLYGDTTQPASQSDSGNSNGAGASSGTNGTDGSNVVPPESSAMGGPTAQSPDAQYAQNNPSAGTSASLPSSFQGLADTVNKIFSADFWSGVWAWLKDKMIIVIALIFALFVLISGARRMVSA